MLAQARDVRDTIAYSYRRGEASFVELIDAQRTFNDTHAELQRGARRLCAEPLHRRRVERRSAAMTAATRLPPPVVLAIAVTAAADASHAETAGRGQRHGLDGAGTLTVPGDSPVLKQIRREKVARRGAADRRSDRDREIEANPNRISKFVAPVAGRIARVLVALGDAVAKGQPLFTIESPDADAATSRTCRPRPRVTQARATLAKAQADADRASDLFEHNAIANKEVLNAKNALAQAQAGLDQAVAAREQAERRLAVLGLTRATSSSR